MCLCFNLFILLFCLVVFFFNDTATTEIYTLSLHDALPISTRSTASPNSSPGRRPDPAPVMRSEEHTSELQSRVDLVCRLLLEKKNKHTRHHRCTHPAARLPRRSVDQPT